MFDHAFEFIHGRQLAVCFNSTIDVFRSAFNSLRPGGHLELHDGTSIDGSAKGTAFEQWKDSCLQGIAKLGRRYDKVSLIRCSFLLPNNRLLPSLTTPLLLF
jgi:hypothetical protein